MRSVSFHGLPRLRSKLIRPASFADEISALSVLTASPEASCSAAGVTKASPDRGCANSASANSKALRVGPA